jgi:hypothetical protein
MRDNLMRAAAAVAAIGLGQPANMQAAWAQDATSAIEDRAGGVRVSGDFSQSFRLDNNFAFTGNGTEFRSFSRANLTLYSETSTSRIAATTGLTFQMDPAGNFSLNTPSLRFNASKSTKRTQYSVNASYSSGPITFEQLQEDLSLVDQRSDQSTLRADFRIGTRMSDTMTASLAGRFAQVDFDPVSAELAPSTDYNLSAILGYRLSRRTSLDFSAGVGIFEGEGVTDAESFSTDLGVAVNHRLDTQTRVNANLGLSYIDNTETIGAVRNDEVITSILFGAGVSYALPDGSVNLTMGRSVGPTADGDLAYNTSFSAGYSKSMTQDSSYGISVGYTEQEPISGGTTESLFSVSPTYTMQLTPEAELEAIYTLQSNEDGDTSHGINLTVVRVFDFPLR